MKIKECITLLPVAIGNLIYTFFLRIYECILYGKYAWWWSLNSQMFFSYLADPPHRIVLRNLHLVPGDKENFVYGETPLFTFEKIITHISPERHDTFIDLGCGRGLPSFYANLLFGLPSFGIDIIPEFIIRARKIKNALKLETLEFIQGDFLDASLPHGTIFFLAGTTFDGSALIDISKRLEVIPGKIKIISLSSPLPSSCFKTLGVGKYWFSWGKSHVYFQVKENSQ